MANLDPIADGQVANAEAPVGKGVAIRYLLAFAVPLLFPAALIALALIYLHSVGNWRPSRLLEALASMKRPNCSGGIGMCRSMFWQSVLP